MLQLVVLIILFIILIVILITSCFFVVTYILQQELQLHVPTLRTKYNDLNVLLTEGHISENDIVYDLGSGNGQTVFLIEKIIKAKTHGIELGISPSIVSRIMKRVGKYKSQFHFKNLLTADISNATVIYAYLLPPVVAQLEASLTSRIKPGTKVILCDYPFTTLKPIAVSKQKRHTFYIYRM